jgi:hypothetical protein
VLLSERHERYLRDHKEGTMKNMLRITCWQWFMRENEEIPQNT